MSGEIREITDLELWDDFISDSSQGTLFSSSKWMSLFTKPYKIYGYYKGNELIAGIIGRHNLHTFDSGFEFTPFQGVLCKRGVKESDEWKVNEAFADCFKFWDCSIINHYTSDEIRPYLWAGWKPNIKFTYLTYPYFSLEKCDKDTRYEIKKEAREFTVEESKSIEAFAKLYRDTFKRKGLEGASQEFIINVFLKMNGKLYFTKKDGRFTSGVMLLPDKHKSYYIFGASDGTGGSSFCLYTAIKECPHQVDLVGGNTKEIALFKRGFGFRITYYQVSNV